ncbi:hypothetical protein L6164_024899 [Bauhinia variegata]|uniref:Uncharacterized protein n=1 Tax=Bauhinia variegata TaxID=167791 RepID=A0ACB9M0D9_BAUVA|nr:hypothetical protein L6164_024899 [Bauhinia variegata]
MISSFPVIFGNFSSSEGDKPFSGRDFTGSVTSGWCVVAYQRRHIYTMKTALIPTQGRKSAKRIELSISLHQLGESETPINAAVDFGGLVKGMDGGANSTAWRRLRDMGNCGKVCREGGGWYGRVSELETEILVGGPWSFSG